MVDMPSSAYGPVWYWLSSHGSVRFSAVPVPALHEMSRPSITVALNDGGGGGINKHQGVPYRKINKHERTGRQTPP